MKIKVVLHSCFIFLLMINSKAFSQNENYNYESWPGKVTEIKKSIKINDNLVQSFELSLAKGYHDNSVFYKMPLSASDTLKEGRLQMVIYSNPLDAQKALVDYLNCLTIVKYPRLDEDLKYWDIAFGKNYDGIFKIAFTKNNVFLIIHAPTNNALLLAKEISSTIESATTWNPDDLKPHLIFTK